MLCCIHHFCIDSIQPDVNPFRDPRYGRGQETGGEDAWVNGQVAIEYVRGLQGGSAADNRWLQATAACKHVPLYDSQTPAPQVHDYNVSIQDMYDYYLKPWRACATVAHSSSMMCSYGSFDGKPDCAHGTCVRVPCHVFVRLFGSQPNQSKA